MKKIVAVMLFVIPVFANAQSGYRFNFLDSTKTQVIGLQGRMGTFQKENLVGIEKLTNGDDIIIYEHINTGDYKTYQTKYYFNKSQKCYKYKYTDGLQYFSGLLTLLMSDNYSPINQNTLINIKENIKIKIEYDLFEKTYSFVYTKYR